MIDKLIGCFLLGLFVGVLGTLFLCGAEGEFLMACRHMFEHHDECTECVQGNGCCTVCNALWRLARKLMG